MYALCRAWSSSHFILLLCDSIISTKYCLQWLQVRFRRRLPATERVTGKQLRERVSFPVGIGHSRLLYWQVLERSDSKIGVSFDKIYVKIPYDSLEHLSFLC